MLAGPGSVQYAVLNLVARCSNPASARVGTPPPPPYRIFLFFMPAGPPTLCISLFPGVEWQADQHQLGLGLLVQWRHSTQATKHSAGENWMLSSRQVEQ